MENRAIAHFEQFHFFPNFFPIDFFFNVLKSQKLPTGKVFVYKIQVNPIHTCTILKYGDYYDFMDS